MINNFRIYILIACLFLTNLMVYGQKLEDGYVVLTSGDTLRGEINLGRSTNFPLKLLNPEAGTITEYDQREVTAYGIEGSRLFLSGLLDNQFVDVLVYGEMTLFVSEEVFYVQKGEEESVKLTRPDPNNINSASLRWIGILKSMMGDCQDLLNLPGARYKYESEWLMEHIEDYHKCTGSEYISLRNEKNTFKPIYNYGVALAGGVVAYNYQFNDNFSASARVPIYGASMLLDISNSYGKQLISHTVGLSSHYHMLKILEEVDINPDYLRRTFEMYASRTTIEMPLSVNFNLFKERNFRIETGFVPYFYLVSRSLGYEKTKSTDENNPGINYRGVKDLSTDLRFDLRMGLSHRIDMGKYYLYGGAIYRKDIISIFRNPGDLNNYKSFISFQIKLMKK